jgi:hypothetical protein
VIVAHQQRPVVELLHVDGTPPNLVAGFVEETRQEWLI